MNWYFTTTGSDPELMPLPFMISENGRLVDSAVLVRREDWGRLVDAGWYREHKEDPYPYMDSWAKPVIAPHPDDGIDVAYLAQGPAMSLEDVRQLKLNEIRAQVPAYTTAQVAGEPQLASEMADATQWSRVAAMEIYSITNWNELAGYDTTRPPTGGLLVEDIAEGMLQQEEDILNRETLRGTLGRGLSPDDKQALETHIAHLYDVIEGNEPVIQYPPAEIRQRVFVTGEKNAPFRVKRTEVQGPNPDTWQAIIVTGETGSLFWMLTYNGSDQVVDTIPFVETTFGVYEATGTAIAQRRGQPRAQNVIRIAVSQGIPSNRITPIRRVRRVRPTFVDVIRYEGSIG